MLNSNDLNVHFTYKNLPSMPSSANSLSVNINLFVYQLGLELFKDDMCLTASRIYTKFESEFEYIWSLGV